MAGDMSERRDLPSAVEVALGAHLHDIGKFMQRAVGDSARLAGGGANPARATSCRRSITGPAITTRCFPKLSSRSASTPIPCRPDLDKRWIRDCAVYHHKPLQDGAAVPNGSITWLVAEADRIAAGMERKKRDEDQESSHDPKRRDDYRRTRLVATPTTVWRENDTKPWPLLPGRRTCRCFAGDLAEDGKDQAT